MQLQIGQFKFPVGQVGCRPSIKSKMDQRSRPYAQVLTLDVDGMLFADDSQKLKAEIEKMRNALAFGTGDVVLYDLKGKPTGINVPANLAIGNRFKLDILRFPEVTGVEWERVISFAFTIMWERALASVFPGMVVEYSEVITRVGTGKPRNTMQETLADPPQRVQLVRQTKCLTNQKGVAVGYLGKPKVAAPLWPSELQEDIRSVTEYTASGYENSLHKVEWDYRYESKAPLKGTSIVPAEWR